MQSNDVHVRLSAFRAAVCLAQTSFGVDALIKSIPVAGASLVQVDSSNEEDASMLTGSTALLKTLATRLLASVSQDKLAACSPEVTQQLSMFSLLLQLLCSLGGLAKVQDLLGLETKPETDGDDVNKEHPLRRLCAAVSEPLPDSSTQGVKQLQQAWRELAKKLDSEDGGETTAADQLAFPEPSSIEERYRQLDRVRTFPHTMSFPFTRVSVSPCSLRPSQSSSTPIFLGRITDAESIFEDYVTPAPALLKPPPREEAHDPASRKRDSHAPFYKPGRKKGPFVKQRTYTYVFTHFWRCFSFISSQSSHMTSHAHARTRTRRREAFRSRKNFTGRKPSMHVDDFVKKQKEKETVGTLTYAKHACMHAHYTSSMDHNLNIHHHARTHDRRRPRALRNPTPARPTRT